MFRPVRSSPIHSAFRAPRLAAMPRPLLRIAYRPFTHSRIIRNTTPVSTPPPAQPIPPPPVAAPPVPPRNSRLRYFRYIPYKTLLALALGFYVVRRIDLTMGDSIDAVLAQFTVPDNTWLYLNLNDLHVTDSPHSDRALQIVPFVSSAGKRRMTVLEMTTTIMDAAADPRVKGMVLSFNQSMTEHRAIVTGEVIESHLGMGVLSEIAEALKFFAAVKILQRQGESPGIEPDTIVDKKTGRQIIKGDEGREYHPSQDVIIAVSDNYGSAMQYSLAAAAASRICMQPSGTMDLTGMSMTQFFFGNVLEKYGVDFKVEARREFKSALANLSGTGWNEPTRQNLEDLLWSLQTQTFSDLYFRHLERQRPPSIYDQSRKVTLNNLEHPEFYALLGIARTIGEEQKSLREAVKPVMDMLQKGPLSFHEALDLGLIDAPMYHQDVLTLLRDEGIKTWSVRKYLDASIAQQIFGDIDRDKWIIPQLFKRSEKEKKSLKEKDGVPGAHLDVKLLVSQPLGGGEPLYGEAVLKVDVVVPRNIGLVYLDNAIEGKGRFGGEAMAAYILKAATDPSIHSIVLRINSPGGDAVASDTIWRAVEIAKRRKPVIASFGDVAASGGYYAAAGADAIITNPYTITGSIGVIAGWPVIKRLLDKVDVTTDSVEFLQNAAWHHMELGLPESEMQKLRSHIDETYDQFKKVVGTGRKMNLEQVEKIARGQIYTGAQALKLGLADSFGSLNFALSYAGKLSLDRAVIEIDDLTKFRQFLGEEFRIQYDDIVSGGEKIIAAMKGEFETSEQFKGNRQPTSEEIHGIVKRVQVSIRPEAQIVIIPHVNLANEALGVAISTAFQSDEERSPIPIDLPLPSPNGGNDDDGENGSQSRIVVGALLGIARSNNIPIWQFPMFCYWYAAQAAGKVGQGMGGGFLDSWFGKLMNQTVFNDTVGYAKTISGGRTETFAGGRTRAWDIRMEMPPLKIFY